MKQQSETKNTWTDYYTQKAQQEKYPARSVFKLREIQQKTNIFQKNQRVLDLGCAPGSWLLQAADYVGSNGVVLGIDLIPVKVSYPSHVETREGDVFDIAPELVKQKKLFDVILSDMAPLTTGRKDVDATRSMALCETALWVADMLLVPGGAFVCKIFQQADFQQFIEKVKQIFEKVKILKPKSTRKASKEIFVIGIQRRGEDHGGA